MEFESRTRDQPIGARLVIGDCLGEQDDDGQPRGYYVGKCGHPVPLDPADRREPAMIAENG
jgi:hypothetical protein